MVSIVCSGGGGKRCYNLIAKDLSFSPLQVINPTEYDKKKFKKNNSFLRTIKNPDWLYVTYRKSIQGVDDIRSLIVRGSNNKILYNISTVNIAIAEVLSPLTDI